ncbi:ATP-binding protein [Acaryochloris sp. CCMEE 5410]|uniref:ATP-binding protein n=1 Tax=Acaryochloris sp. CCMEE 5410 TaxID=310037 RepID=UPI00024848BD|nr:ATP-binding protein [Acaryochloris sp. CCMEE 5410]KAI9132263.1 GAF domain-containing protein [Acaryochloris sp. CCMEE 5410]
MTSSVSPESSDPNTQVRAEIAILTDPDLVPSDVSLTNCDREPIHIPSAIQPHGVLITCTEDDFVIQQISQNALQLLGQPPAALLGQPLSKLLPPNQLDQIRGCLAADFEQVNPLQLRVNGRDMGGVAHRTETVIVLELEPLDNPQPIDFFDFYRWVKAPINHLQQAQTLTELCQTAAAEVRQITGFDRVMVYRFDSDGAGDVIAEDRRSDLEPFLGLHYPATDIPKQAKQLYRLNRLRLIPDATYEPIPLEPLHSPVTQAPLDMSLSVLRSVSPMHTEYLNNMGVRASLSISLLCNQQLWGLIACHHYVPKPLSYPLRTVCEFVGQAVSMELLTKLDKQRLVERVRLQSIQANFVQSSSRYQSLLAAISHHPIDLMVLADASGLVFCEGEQLIAFGQTPPEPTIAPLIHWVSQQLTPPALLYSTDQLGKVYPALADHQVVASGLLALQISPAQNIHLLWFKPEVVQTVNWGGEPKQQQGVDAEGLPYLTPRQSFERWQETVRRKSLPWSDLAKEAVLELRGAIIGIVLKKVDELAMLNADLQRSNSELDAFAYIASHDLKEPLRGIHNYSSFLIEDYGEQLDAEGQHKLETLMRLTQRMEDLISSLLHYSRLGRADLAIYDTDLSAVLAEVLGVIQMSQPESVEFRIPRSLPTLACDRIRVTEVFTNLISNAIKYNNKPHKWIEIGYITPDEDRSILPETLDTDQMVLYVRDNGIGIRERQLENVFKIFKRLHAPNRYGGGTGAGLTIVKKIVERHGGRIAIQSVPREGSTFYFYLGQ